MRAALRISFAIDRLSRRLGKLVAWLTLAMVLIGAFNAVARYSDRFLVQRFDGFGGLSSNAYVEAQWYLFSLVFLLAAPYVLRANRHVRVDVLYGRLSERAQAWIDLLGGVLFLVPFCVFALWTSLPYVVDSWEVREGSPDPGGLARYPIKSAILVAFALLGLQGVSETIKRVALLRGMSASEVGLVEPDERPSRAGGGA